MTTRLRACYFASAPLPQQWPRMAKVLGYTAGVHCPGWDIDVAVIPKPLGRRDIGIPSHVDNTYKLAWWSAQVRASADGDCLLLIDADTMILRPLDDIWARSFDVAYTVRSGFMVPFNAGVVFVRVSPQSRAFMARWVEINGALLERTPKPWRKSFGGVNQAALAELLRETDAMGVHVLPLACREWNCEDSAWKHFDPAVTRIVHIKSALRRACLVPTAMLDPQLATLKALWRQTESEALKEARTA